MRKDVGFMPDDDLSQLSDEALIRKTESAIYQDAILSSRGRFSQSTWDEIDRLSKECDRRTPNQHLYIRAWNRAAAGTCSPDTIPPDPRVKTDD